MYGSKIHIHAVGILLLFTLITLGCRNEEDVRPALIPMPQNISWNNEKYDLSDSSHSFIQRIVDRLPGVSVNEQEAYTLLVTGDSVVLSALTPAGISHGMKTVRQLTRSEKGKRSWHLRKKCLTYIWEQPYLSISFYVIKSAGIQRYNKPICRNRQGIRIKDLIISGWYVVMLKLISYIVMGTLVI